MNVHLKPDLERRLAEMAALRGISTDAYVQEMLEVWLEDSSALREMIERRYDDVKSGREQTIDGEEAYRQLKAKTQAERLLRK